MSVNINSGFPDHWSGCELSFKYHSAETTTEEWRKKPAPQPYSRLQFVTGGSGVFYSENQKIELKPGNVYLMPSAIPSGYYGTDSVDIFGFEFFLTLPDGYDFFSSCNRYLSFEMPVEQIFEIINWYKKDDIACMIRLKGVVWECLARFIQMLSPEEMRPVRYSIAVKKAVQYIQGNLSSTLATKDVSDAIFTSASSLNRKFQREMGISVSDYIEHSLMMKAQRKLLTTGASIGAISMELGYCDQFYFSRRFKKYFNISPKHFREVNGKT